MLYEGTLEELRNQTGAKHIVDIFNRLMQDQMAGGTNS
jgi:hypothetical protein